VIFLRHEAADRKAEHIDLGQSNALMKATASAPISSNVVGTSPELLETPALFEQDHLAFLPQPVGNGGVPIVHRAD